VANVGYCGLDRRRSPLGGDEIRACWDGIVPIVVEERGPVTDRAPAPIQAAPEFSLFADLD
jgi:hypothetical protein